MITLCAIAKNESEALADWVKSLSNFVEEIVLVDNGSTDDTREIAEKLGCTLYSCTDRKIDECRNLYLQKAHEPWILVLDIDERIAEQDMRILREVAKGDSDFSMYNLKRYDYLGRLHWSVSGLNRFFRYRNGLCYNDSPIHATLTHSLKKLCYSQKYCSAMIQHIDFLYHNNSGYYQKKLRYIQLINEEIMKTSENDFFRAWLNLYLGLEYFATDQVEEAKKHIEKSILMNSKRINSNYYLGIFCLAQLYMLNGEYSKIYGFVRKMMTSNDPYIIDKALFLSTLNAYKHGKYNESLDFIQKAIKMNPDYAHNYLNKFIVLRKMGRNGDEDFQRALSINPMLGDEKVSSNWKYRTSFSLQNMIVDDL